MIFGTTLDGLATRNTVGSEGGECPTNKGSVAGLGGCVAPPPHLCRTYKVLAFVTSALVGLLEGK